MMQQSGLEALKALLRFADSHAIILTNTNN